MRDSQSPVEAEDGTVMDKTYQNRPSSPPESKGRCQSHTGTAAAIWPGQARCGRLAPRDAGGGDAGATG